MIDKMLATIAPHLCLGCQKIGSILCDHCKLNIIKQPLTRCILCARESQKTICLRHKHPFSQAFIVGARRGTLQKTIDAFKFHNARAAAPLLASLLASRLPRYTTPPILVPIPTARTRVRFRGYDHTLLLARALAKQHGCIISPLLERHGTAEQKTATRTERLSQAAVAYTVTGVVSPTAHYLLVDDVVTTGATVFAAADVLQRAGATQISLAALAWQPLDEP